ncbi:MAG: ParB/RepB/Spo0J family partition protein [Pseudomonadota bacterium]
MAKKPPRKALGRGLSALLGDAGSIDQTTLSGAPAQPEGNDAPDRPQPGRLPIDKIHPNPAQPRRNFRDEDLAELAESLKVHGVIQPVLVRPDPNNPGDYQLVAGERRWRAAQLAGVHELPAVVRELDDQQLLELAIIENVQRVDLDPIEEADGYSQLIETFGYTQADLAQVIGKSRSHVTNMMRLLSLPERVREFLQTGQLSIGHARALVNAPAPVTLAERAVAEGLTVRQVEAMAKIDPLKAHEAAVAKAAAKPKKDADTRMLEGDLTAAIKMRVRIEHGAEGSGEVRIRYKSLEQLDDLCRKLAE